MADHQEISRGIYQITCGILTEANHMEERIAATKREIDKLEDKRSYFEGIVANSEFPDLNEMVFHWRSGNISSGYFEGHE